MEARGLWRRTVDRQKWGEVGGAEGPQGDRHPVRVCSFLHGSSAG